MHDDTLHLHSSSCMVRREPTMASNVVISSDWWSWFDSDSGRSAACSRIGSAEACAFSPSLSAAVLRSSL